MFVQFLIPFIILIICYGKIVWVLTRRINTDLIKTTCKATVDNSNNFCGPINNFRTISKSVDLGNEKFQLARRNTIKTLLIVGLCFIICWSQNEVEYFMYNCGYDLDFNSTRHQFSILMVFLNCTVNPFIYLIKYRDYQEALRAFFNCIKEDHSKSLNSSTISSSNI